MPFTFSEYLDYWLNDVCAQGSNGSRTLVQKQWTINLIIQPHLHKDILLGCVTPDYLNKVLESCQAYCCNGGYYACLLYTSKMEYDFVCFNASHFYDSWNHGQLYAERSWK